jgi:hypothetical protein
MMTTGVFCHELSGRWRAAPLTPVHGPALAEPGQAR